MHAETLDGLLLDGGTPTAPALETGSGILDYATLREAHRDTTQQLAALGIGVGDRVLLVLPNGPEHLVALLAVVSLGAVAVPLAPELAPARLAAIVGDVAPALCLAGAAMAAPEGLQTRFLTWSGETRRLVFGPAPASVAPSMVSAGDAEIDAVIRFTSGSTGAPKGARFRHAQLVATARMLVRVYGLNAAHRELLLTSMALSGGWQRVAATLAAGGCVIIGEAPLSVSALMDDLQRCAATGFFSTPPLIRMLLKAPPARARAALQQCHGIEIGSAPLRAAELRDFMALAPSARIFVHYGMTECSRAVILDARAYPDDLDTVGLPAPGVAVEIRDQNGRPVAPGTPGQVYLRGPQMASGYWNRPALTRERFIDGWLATGDMGRLDGRGFLRLLHRADDMINSGGHSFSPAEVEQALGPVADAAQYLVAGVPDPRGILGEVAWAFVVPLEPEDWTPNALLALARERLPAFMVPRRVVPVRELPLTPSGKYDRRGIVALYSTGAADTP